MINKSNFLSNLKFFFLMTFGSAMVVGIAYIDIQLGTITKDSESLTELAELVMLLFTIYGFYSLSKHRTDLNRALILIAAFFLVMVIRELDAVFDQIVHGFWKVPALCVTFSALYYFSKEFKLGLVQFKEIISTPSFKFLLFGMVFLLVYSRLIGMGSLWKALMQENYIYAVKTTIEETTELFGYFIIAFSSIAIKKELKN